MDRSSSPARISPSRRWLSGVSIAGTTISPCSPRVHVTRTTRRPAATDLAMTPPVPIVSSSGWAWTVIRVGRWGSGAGASAVAEARWLSEAVGSSVMAASSHRSAVRRPPPAYHPRMARAHTPAEPGPLTGIRIVDCSTVLAGPYATMLLADLGADVIKVEPPDGDATRGWGPPWVGSLEDGTRTAAYALAVNRNKRSIRLDLRQPEGGLVLRRLLAGADVLVENHRPGGLARLGFGDDVL